VGSVWPSASRGARTNNKHLRSQSRFGVALLAAIKKSPWNRRTAYCLPRAAKRRHAASSQGTAHLRLSRRAWCRRRRKRSCPASAQPPRRAHHCGRHPLRDISVRLRCSMFRSCHAPCARPVSTTSPGTRNAFFRQLSLSAGHAASSSEPFTKLTCGRVVTLDAMSGRLASKSTPMHLFKSDSPRADRERPQKTASPRRNEPFSVRTLRHRPRVLHRETPAVSCILTGASSGRQGWPI
jgi:hypothetical protein